MVPGDKPENQVAKDKRALSLKAAAYIAANVISVLQQKDTYSIALSGGSTPQTLYTLLADKKLHAEEIPWESVHIFWGDERHVPPDHPESNYLMAYETLLSKVPLPPENIHRIKAENPDANEAAEEYSEELRRTFFLAEGQLPRLDCVLLGLGPDGHTASLFPGTRALVVQDSLVTANWVPKFKNHRITMTVPVLNNADVVLFLVSGGDKAAILKEVLEGPQDPHRLPSQLIKPSQGKLLWLLDEAAADKLLK
jgi:6-phosphogluconolactonase